MKTHENPQKPTKIHENPPWLHHFQLSIHGKQNPSPSFALLRRQGGQGTVHGANGEALTRPMQQETQLFHLQNKPRNGGAMVSHRIHVWYINGNMDPITIPPLC